MEDSEYIKSESENVRDEAASNFYLTLSEEHIQELPLTENPSHLSVTAVLHYCKYKILRPYLRLLSVTGLRSASILQIERLTCRDIAGIFYTIQVVALMIFGYVLQYMACFQRDRGFCYKIVNLEDAPLSSYIEERNLENQMLRYEKVCHGSPVFSYIIPSSLHLIAYLCGVFIFRSSDNDQLPSLMERVFLVSSNITEGFLVQKKLVRLLWIFVALSIIWMLLSSTSVIFMMFQGTISFKWLETRPNSVIVPMKVMLILCTLWHDTIQATVISSYCLQTQLLTSYLNFLRAKLLQYPIQSTEWMREISEFKKLLKYLNGDLSTPVCIFTLINLCWSISGTFWLLGFDHVDKETLPINFFSILNVLLWITIALAPFLQAARLTGACKLMRSIGHEVRVRPFAHQGTPGNELDSILLYASSLDMSATLFNIPITGRALAIGITSSAIIILVVGQCHYLNY